jgi:predicted RNA-binding protein with PIN domain
MFHVIDGYNVTKRDPATRELSLEDQRHALEARMRTRARTAIGTTDYLIIWDGAGGKGIVHANSNHVRFTRLDTADDAIVARVREENRRVCIVTSDNGLVRRCKSAATQGVEIKPSDILFEDAPLFAALKPETTGKQPRHRKSSNAEPGIPPFANEINQELKNIWGIED